jgi:hypothetical protein
MFQSLTASPDWSLFRMLNKAFFIFVTSSRMELAGASQWRGLIIALRV